MQFRHPLLPLALSLERKFGKLAFPTPVRILAIFQLAVFLLSMLLGPSYYTLLTLDYVAVTQKFELWRILTFMFLFPPGLSPIFVIFAFFILWMINDGLEQAWGTFRLNLFLFTTWLGILLGTAVMPLLFPGQEMAALMARNFGLLGPVVLSCILFISFASVYPNHEILLIVIPIKVKWLALINAVFLISIASTMGGPSFLFIAFSMAAYFTVFLPHFLWWIRHRQETAVRKAKFKVLIYG